MAATVVIVPASKVSGCVDDDGALLQGGAARHDLDLVLATGDLEVVGDLGVLEALDDEVAAGVDIDGRGVAGAVEDADLGHLIGHLVLGADCGRDDRCGRECGHHADEGDLAPPSGGSGHWVGSFRNVVGWERVRAGSGKGMRTAGPEESVEGGSG